MRTCVPSLTSQGSPYGRFRKALDRGNVTEALSAAAELQHVGLTEALELCLLLHDKAAEKYGRAAVRWHSRCVRELPGLTIEDSQAVLAALGAIAGDHRQSAARALAELLNGHDFEQAGEVLMRWAGERPLSESPPARKPSRSAPASPRPASRTPRSA
jgi:hypothetical protein